MIDKSYVESIFIDICYIINIYLLRNKLLCNIIFILHKLYIFIIINYIINYNRINNICYKLQSKIKSIFENIYFLYISIMQYNPYII